MKISVSVLAGELIDLKKDLEKMDPQLVDLLSIWILWMGALRRS